MKPNPQQTWRGFGILLEIHLAGLQGVQNFVRVVCQHQGLDVADEMNAEPVSFSWPRSD